MIKTYFTLLLLTIVMISAVAYGINESGSPFETRGKKFDQQRVADISSLTYAVESYYNKYFMLPDKLADVDEFLYGDKNIADPETKNEYEYQKGTSIDYKICATFSTDSTKRDEKKDPYNYYDFNGKFAHPKGYHCFELNVNGEVANKITDINNIVRSPQFKETVNDVQELTKRSRDATRLTDLANLQQAINVAVQEATVSGVTILCANTKAYPCGGRSLTDSTLTDGTGWLKTNLNSQRAVSVPSLPKDPMNDGIYHYTYCANGDAWEINAVLESSQHSNKMSTDGGDDDSKYEVGSSFQLIDKTTGCSY